MNTIVTASDETGSDRVITDTSETGALNGEDQAWSVRDSPRAEEHGLERTALVMPQSVVAEVSVERVLEATDDGIERNVFGDQEEARAWIAAERPAP